MFRSPVLKGGRNGRGGRECRGEVLNGEASEEARAKNFRFLINKERALSQPPEAEVRGHS